jgi:hypothetical protein
MKSDQMKKNQLIQIAVAGLIVLSGCAMIATTTIYDDVYTSIVQVLCLSCIKLEPLTSSDYTFETAHNQPHIDYVLENLKTGVVFLHFSEDACYGCDVMYPVIKDLFSIDFGKEEMIYYQLSYNNQTVHYYYTNIDHAIKERIDAFFVYDKDHIGGLPMFTIATVGYDSGIIKPYYTSLYGTLNINTDEKRLEFLQSIMQESLQLWDENHVAYHPEQQP